MGTRGITESIMKALKTVTHLFQIQEGEIRMKYAYLVVIVVSLLVLYQATLVVQSCVAGESAADETASQEPMTIEGFGLIVNLEKDQVGPCQPIRLAITIKNASEDELSFWETCPESDYRFIVEDDKGQVVPLTRYGQRIEKNREIVLSAVPVALKPNDERQDTILLNRIYDMTIEGKYDITAWRHVRTRDNKGHTKLISNTVEVEIAEEDL